MGVRKAHGQQRLIGVLALDIAGGHIRKHQLDRPSRQVAAPGDGLAPKAARAVACFLAGFRALNTYWGLRGTAGVA